MSHIDDSLLNEYLDEQLDVAVYERVDAHLAACVDCRERLVEARQLFAALSELPEVPLRVDLSRQVVARISAELKPQPIPRWTIPVFVFQIVAAVVLFVWLWPTVQPLLENGDELLAQTAENLQPALSFSNVAVSLVDGLDSGLKGLAEIGEGFSLHASLPILEGFLIIGVALILWLAGSGFLLRESLVMRNKTFKEG